MPPKPSQADLRQDAKLNLVELLKQFVGATAHPVENPVITSVGTAALRVFLNKPNRVGGFVINTSLNRMWMALNAGVVAGAGIFLAPNGGGKIFDWREDFEMVGWEWFIIADAAASSLYSVEIVT